MLNLINNIGNDKKGHYLAGSLLMWSLMVVWIIFEPPFIWLVGIHFVISIGKEVIYDLMFKNGKFEILDAIFTFAPMTFMWWFLYALKLTVI